MGGMAMMGGMECQAEMERMEREDHLAPQELDLLDLLAPLALLDLLVLECLGKCTGLVE